MLTTVDLDDQHRFQAHEIGDAPSDAMLEAPFQPADLTVAEALPNAILSFGTIAAKLRSVAVDLTSNGRHPASIVGIGRRQKTLPSAAFPTMLRIAGTLGGSAQPSPARGRGLESVVRSSAGGKARRGEAASSDGSAAGRPPAGSHRLGNS